MNDRAERLVRELSLQPHPEGGYYRQTFKSSAVVTSDPHRSGRAALTAIDFLLVAGEHSRWHRVTSDEIWTHLDGSGIALWSYDGRVVRRSDLAPLDHGSPVVVVPGFVWQAAEVLGEYALVGCFVAPGFEFQDFALMADDPEARDTLELAQSTPLNQAGHDTRLSRWRVKQVLALAVTPNVGDNFVRPISRIVRRKQCPSFQAHLAKFRAMSGNSAASADG